jgi:type IV pilus assembly protein PilM
MAESVGLDIGSYSIKLAVVKGGFGGDMEIVRMGEEHNPTGQVLPADEADFGRLAGAIKQLVTDQKVKGKSVYSGLPESMVHTAIISLPNLSDAELASSIHWEAEQHIPMPLSEVNLEYEVLYRPDKDDIAEKMTVMLVAARKEMVDRLVSLTQTAGVELVGLETSLLGIYRALRLQLNQEAAMILVHLGALSTDILITHNGDVVLNYSIASGGLAFTRAIEQSLGLPPNQAEEYKRAYGLDGSQLEGKVRQALMSVMNVLSQEIKKAIHFYQTAHQMAPVRTMWVSGGSAYLPGLSQYLAETFSMEVDMVNPASVMRFGGSVQQPKNAAAFMPAIGFAMQED